MRIEQLRIEGFRNIGAVSLDLCSGFNALAGKNGAGKTSILEAIYTLGYGRSFRSRLTEPLIGHGFSEYVIFAQGRTARGLERRLGLAKDLQNAPRVHIDGQPTRTLGDLVRLMPVVEIDATSLDLIDQGPGQRRSYLDWGVFHVEQADALLWSRFRRVLQQRNSLLKSGQNVDWAYWDAEFSRLSEAIDQSRSVYLQQLLPVLRQLLSRLLGEQLTWEFDYFPGWVKSAGSLTEQLTRGRQREQLLGRTLKGAQVAELSIDVDGVPVRDRLSRGQKKLLIATLKFAQVRLYNSAHAEPCILLLDDFPAELDADSMDKIRSLLGDLQCQIVAAAVEPADLAKMNPGSDTRLFHVEQGQIELKTETD